VRFNGFEREFCAELTRQSSSRLGQA
jgi:hypothetical protein